MQVVTFLNPMPKPPLEISRVSKTGPNRIGVTRGLTSVGLNSLPAIGLNEGVLPLHDPLLLLTLIPGRRAEECDGSGSETNRVRRGLRERHSR